MNSQPRAYVQTITARGKVIGYGVCDKEGGIEIMHERYMIGGNSAAACLKSANDERDRMNRGRGLPKMRA